MENLSNKNHDKFVLRLKFFLSVLFSVGFILVEFSSMNRKATNHLHKCSLNKTTIKKLFRRLSSRMKKGRKHSAGVCPSARPAFTAMNESRSRRNQKVLA